MIGHLSDCGHHLTVLEYRMAGTGPFKVCVSIKSEYKAAGF